MNLPMASTFFDKLSGTGPVVSPDLIDLSAMREGAVPKRAAPRPRAVQQDPSAPLAPTMSAKEESPEEVGVQDEDQGDENTEEGELTVDIFDRGDSIVIQSTVAGVKPEHLDVSITDDTVAIRGKREQGEKIPDNQYYYKELFWGTFARSVILPVEIEQDEAEADLHHGLLTLKLPKKKKGITQKLKVKIV